MGFSNIKKETIYSNKNITQAQIDVFIKKIKEKKIIYSPKIDMDEL
jgi:hypothetical protein